MATTGNPTTVSAWFPDTSYARKAIASLESSGVDGSRIELKGPAGRQARDPGQIDPQADKQIAGRGMKAGLGGVIIGAVVGAVLGFVAGTTIIGNGALTWPGIALGIGGLVAGAGVGLAVGGYSKIRQSQAWQETFDAPEDIRARVEVRVDDDEQYEKIAGILSKADGEVEG